MRLRNLFNTKLNIAIQAANYLDESGNACLKAHSVLVDEAKSWLPAHPTIDMKTLAALVFTYGRYDDFIEIEWSFVELAKNYIFGGHTYE